MIIHLPGRLIAVFQRWLFKADLKGIPSVTDEGNTVSGSLAVYQSVKEVRVREEK